MLNDRELTNKLSGVVNELYQRSIDTRLLQAMKMGFVSKDKVARGKMGKEDFKKLFNSTMRGVEKEEKKDVF